MPSELKTKLSFRENSDAPACLSILAKSPGWLPGPWTPVGEGLFLDWSTEGEQFFLSPCSIEPLRKAGTPEGS